MPFFFTYNFVLFKYSAARVIGKLIYAANKRDHMLFVIRPGDQVNAAVSKVLPYMHSQFSYPV